MGEFCFDCAFVVLNFDFEVKKKLEKREEHNTSSGDCVMLGWDVGSGQPLLMGLAGPIFALRCFFFILIKI